MTALQPEAQSNTAKTLVIEAGNGPPRWQLAIAARRKRGNDKASLKNRAERQWL